MKKEIYEAPTVTCHTLETCCHLLNGSADGKVPDIGIVDEVKAERFDFNESPFTENPWEY